MINSKREIEQEKTTAAFEREKKTEKRNGNFGRREGF